MSKREAKYNALLESPISESSKAVYYYENLAATKEIEAMDELEKLGSDMSLVYRTVAEAYSGDSKTGENYDALIESDISEEEKYTVLLYTVADKDNRQDIVSDVNDVYNAGGTIDNYLIARRAICGIESDKDRNGKTIQNSRSKKRLRAINQALPDAPYKLRVVLYEICGVGKSVYNKKKTKKAEFLCLKSRLRRLSFLKSNCPSFKLKMTPSKVPFWGMHIGMHVVIFAYFLSAF